MTLVDTSIWVNHLRTGNPRLESLLQDTRVLIHPWIIGELACGEIKNREEILALLQALPETQIPEHHEVLHLLETHKLYGMGLGWVDMNLLAAAQLTGCTLWTADIPLQKAAAKLHLPK
ncbi:MAG: type II toxin-antitoxin system VapC family toxin [Nitrospirales bacterium]|nr:type II toxin-antitoxin system VapC family toxin [Nitrospira sp.]MDR4501213.1 type II toxin-antitoxin system VapC family toxin [Nitrospirales bacterium]